MYSYIILNSDIMAGRIYHCFHNQDYLGSLIFPMVHLDYMNLDSYINMHLGQWFVLFLKTVTYKFGLFSGIILGMVHVCINVCKPTQKWAPLFWDFANNLLITSRGRTIFQIYSERLRLFLNLRHTDTYIISLSHRSKQKQTHQFPSPKAVFLFNMYKIFS